MWYIYIFVYDTSMHYLHIAEDRSSHVQPGVMDWGYRDKRSQKNRGKTCARRALKWKNRRCAVCLGESGNRLAHKNKLSAQKFLIEPCRWHTLNTLSQCVGMSLGEILSHHWWVGQEEVQWFIQKSIKNFCATIISRAFLCFCIHNSWVMMFYIAPVYRSA